MAVDFVQDVTEMGRAVEFTIVESLLVTADHTWNTIDSGVENVAV